MEKGDAFGHHERTVLLLGKPLRPWELEDAFPGHRIVVMPGGAGAQEAEGLISALWERSMRLDVLVLREALPAPEITAFLAPEAQLLVEAPLARQEAWSDFLSMPWLREQGIQVQLLEPGKALDSLLPKSRRTVPTDWNRAL